MFKNTEINGCQLHDQHLFQDILRNANHVLHPSLPPVHFTPYSLRPHSHNRTIPNLSACTVSQIFSIIPKDKKNNSFNNNNNNNI